MDRSFPNVRICLKLFEQIFCIVCNGMFLLSWRAIELVEIHTSVLDVAPKELRRFQAIVWVFPSFDWICADRRDRNDAVMVRAQSRLKKNTRVLTPQDSLSSSSVCR